MTIRRKQKTSPKLGRNSNFSNRRKKVLRDLKVENLEERRMLFGPQLAGIQVNSGALLEDGDQLDTAPAELRLRIDANQVIDNATVANSIEITRSGFDNLFARATADTDFNTGGRVRMRFSSQQVGAGGNGVQLIFSASDQGNAGLPLVTTFGQVVAIDLNTNLGNESTAADLLSVLNNGPASSLLSAEISGGFAGEAIANSPLTYSPIILSGANQAVARSSFNIGSALQIRFTATQLGPPGNGIAVTVTKADLGPGTAAAIGVNGRTVNVTLNENAVGATTSGGLVSAINGNSAAASILTAAVEVGSATQVITGPPVTYSPIVLDGANDVTVQPGFIGIGETPNEVIVRFAETLPDDLYLIDIHGSGSSPLRNEAGELFNMGTDVTVNFDLDVAPLVRAIIPQPVHRDAGGNLFQQRDKIVVHFNDDDLLVENDGSGNPTRRSVEHPSFFKLILTNDTVENTDDVVFLPNSVAYDSVNDVAILTFDGDLSELVDRATGNVVGAGTFRLRVGTNEEAFLAPNVVNIDVVNDPGASFVSARELEIDGSWDTGAILEVIGTGADVIDGQLITLTNDKLERTTLEFESGFVIGIEQTLTLNFPADGGNSINDGDTIVINDGVQDVVFEFDEVVPGSISSNNLW